MLSPSLLVYCLPFSSCSNKKIHTDTYYGYFDSFATLTVHGASKKDYEVYHSIFTAEIDKYHRLLDPYNEYADTVNLCTLNHYAAKEPVTVSTDMLDFLVPKYIEEGKNNLVVAIGCTGGKHRSVTLASHIYETILNLGYKTKIVHRDINKGR